MTIRGRALRVARVWGGERTAIEWRNATHTPFTLALSPGGGEGMLYIRAPWSSRRVDILFGRITLLPK